MGQGGVGQSPGVLQVGFQEQIQRPDNDSCTGSLKATRRTLRRMRKKRCNMQEGYFWSCQPRSW